VEGGRVGEVGKGQEKVKERGERRVEGVGDEEGEEKGGG